MNVGIIGRRGLGKSTLALSIAQSLNSDSIVIFDTNNQFKNAEHRTSDLKDVEAQMKKDQTFVAYIPPGDVENDFDLFAAKIWKFGDYVLIIDESHRLQSPQRVNQWLDKFMRQAPRRERNDENPVDIIQCFHKPVDMNGTVLALLDQIYFFRVTRTRDLEFVEREFDGGTAVAISELKTPPEGREILRVDVESGESTVISDPSEWYINIRKQPKKEFQFI